MIAESIEEKVQSGAWHEVPANDADDLDSNNWLYRYVLIIIIDSLEKSAKIFRQGKLSRGA